MQQQQRQMSPEQALGILYEATEAINANRAQHAQIVLALSTIKQAITPVPEKEEKSEREPTKRASKESPSK